MSRGTFSDLLASLVVLAWVVEARDPYTGGHLWRVSRYSRMLAQALELPGDEVARIAVGALLHDLGKIGIPDSILRKPERLTAVEYEVIKTHPELGARMLAGHPLGGFVRDIVLLHHERPDGLGYPEHRASATIPIAARIVSVCDAFDAMTSHRPFRAGMNIPSAIAIIDEQGGTQLDRDVANRFIELARANVLSDVIGHSDAGIPLESCPTCGPTLVVRHEHRAGDTIFCGNCANAFELEPAKNGLAAIPTGGRGTARDILPSPDHQLIGRLVSDAVRALPVAALLEDWRRRSDREAP